MKILHIADTHLHATTAENVEHAMRQTLELARGEVPDLIVHAGDLAMSASTLTPDVSEKLRAWFVSLAEIAPCIVVAGNHDLNRNGGAGVLRGTLSRAEQGHGIWLCDNPHVFPGVTAMRMFGGPILRTPFPIAVLPYPNKAMLAAFDPTIPASELNANASGKLEELVRSLAAQMPGPGLLVFHGSINGAVTGTEQRMGTEIDIVLRESAIPEVFRAVLCGHIHKPQVIKRAVYAGSPCPLDFGEASHDHGAVIWESSGTPGDSSWSHRFVSFEPLHRLITLRAPAWEDGPMALNPDEMRGARVRVIAPCPRGASAQRVADAHRDTVMEAGAHSVSVIVEREQEDRAGDSSSVTPSATLDSLLTAYCERSPDAKPYLAEMITLGAEIDGALPPEVRAQERLGDYRLLAFEARNFKCLSEVPRVDVTNLGRIVALVGDNGQGKSATLEIEGFALWGKTPRQMPLGRYVKEGTDECAVVVEFEAQGQTYRVRRSVEVKNDGNGKGSLLLERSTVEPDRIIEPTEFSQVWTPAGGTNSRETQRAIEALVGTWEMYCNTRNSSQGDAARINESTPGELKELLQAALGTGIFEHRERLASVRAVAEEKAADRISAELAVLDQRAGGLDAARENVTTEEQRAEGRRADVVLADRSVDAAENAVSNLRADVTAAEAIEARRKAARERLASIEGRSVALAGERRAAEEAIAAGEEARTAIDAHDSNVAELARLDSIASEHGRLQVEATRAVTAYNEAADGLTSSYCRLEREHRDAAAQAAHAPEREARLVAEAQRSAQRIEAEKATAGLIDTMPFGQKCADAKCSLLALPIAARDGLAALQVEHEGMLIGHDAMRLAEAQLAVKVERLAKELDTLRMDNERKLAGLRAAMEAAEGALDNLIAFDDCAAEVLRDQVGRFDMDAERARRTTADQARGALARIQKEIDALIVEAELVDQETQDGHPADVLDAARKALTDAEGELTLARSRATEAQAAENEARTALAVARDRLKGCEADALAAFGARESLAYAQRRLDVARIFARAMGKDGLPYLMLERAIPALEEHANRFLSAGDLRIEIEPMRDLRSGAQRSDVVIEFRNQWGKIPLAGASGAERNEIGAALRVAISCVQAESRGLRVSHVILDEIFANKAEIRMPQCQQMLRLFAEWAGRCFCVAHQPALAEVADDRIEVAGGVARVVGAREAVTA